MKKLLSILTISTLTANIPAPLLANTTLTRAKRDVGATNSNNNNELITVKIKNFNVSTENIIVDSKDNIYFGTSNGAFVLKHEETTATPINGITDYVYSLAVDSKDNIYFGTSDGAYKLTAGSTTPTKINGISGSLGINIIFIDSKDNIYFGTSNGAYVLDKQKNKINRIEELNFNVITQINIDNNSNIVISTDSGFYIYDNSNFKFKELKNIKTNQETKYDSILNFCFDKNNNIYFGTDNGAYEYNIRVDLISKIRDIPRTNLVFKKQNNNIYFGTSDGVFVLKHGETTATKIDGITDWIKRITVDSKDNIYFGTNNSGLYILQKNGNIATNIKNTFGKIPTIALDSKDNIYFGTSNGAYVLQTVIFWLKTNINVNLIDKSKNIVWLRDDQLVVNGQVKVKIANTDIETIKVNGAIMSSPDKKWDFDLPDTSTVSENRDYNIEIAFKLDGKSYTGQIIVSSLLSQPSINVQKNTSPFGNVASYVYQVPTNDKVGEFTLTSDLYYSDTEVKVSLNKPTGSTVQSGVVYGLNENWQKTGEQLSITGDLSLNATMLNSYQGRFLVETKDSADNSSFYYIFLNKDNLTPNFWDTNHGKQFYEWASLNGYNESIKKLNATELNKIINESKNWQQIASDSQFATSVADWFKTNGKLSATEPLTKEQVITQLQIQIPSDIKIPAVNTSNFDVNKASFVLNQSEFKPNDKVNITVKYNSATSEQFTLQIKDSKSPDNKKDGDSKLWIIGVVAGVLVALGIAYLLFKRFVFDKYIYPKIIARRHNKLVEQIKKEEAEKDAQNNKGGK